MEGWWFVMVVLLILGQNQIFHGLFKSKTGASEGRNETWSSGEGKSKA